MRACLFCGIVSGDKEADIVYEDERTMVFLDHRPVMRGHCLVTPLGHYETLADLPPEMNSPLFETVKLTMRAVGQGLGAQGSFVGVNNIVSQSVPHLHVHVIPRSRGDGMKGFFWPRRPYRDAEELGGVLEALRSAIKSGA